MTIDRLLHYQSLGFETRRPSINKNGFSDINLRKAAVQYLKRLVVQHNLIVLTRKWDRVTL